MPTPKLVTPIQKALAAIGMTQMELARLANRPQPTISRLCTGSLPCSRDMAALIIDVVDPGRTVIDERHLLFPERYTDWQPPGHEVKAPETITAQAPAVAESYAPQDR